MTDSPIIVAAVEYAARGWSVIPVKGDKRPAVGAWRSAQTIAAKAGEVPDWFERVKSAAGVGIVLGAVSGGLWVRDFDDAGAYTRWAAEHPEMAMSLPTVRTRRGWHVYGRWKGIRTATMTDGELRGEGAYIVAPPTRADTGTVYAWAVPLPTGDVPEVDPAAAGLAQGRKGKGCATERTERTERTETPERTERTEDTEDTEDTEAIGERWPAETERLILDVVTRTLPPGIGRRNLHLFKLARALKAIPALAAIAPDDVVILKPIVREWHRRAMPNMLSKDFGTTWGDFSHAWARVKHAEGEDVLSAALQAAESSAPPEWAAEYAPQQRLLASLCRELQRKAGEAPFFLGCKTAGESVGVDKGTACRWFAAFVADKALVCVVKGNQTSGKATRWRYVAKDLHESKQPGTLGE